MEVQGLGSVGGSMPIGQPRPIVEKEQAVAAVPMSPNDEVDISTVGKMLDDVSRTSGVREQRLAQIKTAIEDGTYDTPEKLELALNRMLESIEREEPRR